MNLRKHYKLYKSGKQWCTMALAVIASTIAMTTAVNADTNVANVSDQEVTSSTQNNSNDAILSDTNEVSLASVNIENNDTTISSDNSVEKTESSASTIQAKDNQNDLKSDSQKAENDPVDNVYAISLAAVQPQASNGKNGWVNENNQWTYYTNNEVASGRNYSYLPSINGNGKSWYLVDNGVVQSGVQQWAGSYYDFDANNNYQRVDNNYVQSQWGDWYLFGNDGRILSGLQKWFGSYYYFDPVTYLKVTNKNITVNGINLHADNDGILSGVNRNANFLLSIHDAALDGWRQFGVLPSVTAAQAILESAWGQSALATQGHNLFGIKGSYNGQSITMRTAEYGNGGYYYINDAFRKYPSNYESIVDHGRFLATNSRYNNLLWKKDYTVVTQYLHADGYATDPKYASSLNNVIRTYNLDAWDREVI